MSSKFCLNGTIGPDSPSEFKEVLVDMNIGGILLGTVLLLGCCLSIIPQHVKIIKTKSVVGLSFLWMFLGNVNQFGGFINMFVLKFPQVQACGALGFKACGPSLLSLFQSFGIWIFSFPIYILYLIFAPNDLKFIEKENFEGLPAAKREYKSGKLFFLLFVLFLSSVILVVGILLSNIVGVCTHTTYIFGYSMGMISTIVTFIQWSPQIYKTIKAKTVGSFSIIMLCIQGPGSLVNLYFLIFVSKESLSTWLAYLCSSIQIFILLALLIFYDRKNKRIVKELSETTIIEEQDLFSGSPSQSVLNYKETHPLLFNKNISNVGGGKNQLTLSKSLLPDENGNSILSSTFNKSYLNQSTNDLDDINDDESSSLIKK